MKRNSPAKTKKPLKTQLIEATSKKKRIKKKNNVLWMPGGSITFNIACTGHWNRFCREGRMVNIIGDSSSGKSILVLSALAATSLLSKFDKYRFIYDDAEFADSFDHAKLFGKKLAKRLEAPTPDGTMSTTIENFYDNVMDACDNERPFIYVLDSFDAIDADAEIEKELQNREHRKAGNLSKIKGSFQATKQKKASQMFRHIVSRLKQTRSILIIISQTRDNLTAGSFVKHYRSGGRALKFYASIETWLTYISPIQKTINKIKYDIGVNTRAKITKNKFTGKKGQADFPIYPSYGIDDVSSCIDYLLTIGHWKTKKATIICPELKFKGTKKSIIDFIEKKKELREKKLYKTTAKAVKRIQGQLDLKRKPKFG